jgi:hypothetical protein
MRDLEIYFSIFIEEHFMAISMEEMKNKIASLPETLLVDWKSISE